MNNIGNVHTVKTLAKMGYIARGVVYLVIGGLAGLFAFGVYSVLEAIYREINIDNAPSGVKP